ncbi:GlxA family transcriptional regulator [Azospirillum sp. SYSU D00513]|uniref:GlxA family transcriptional regulator n=1 Tax=Azospirillum sp. SYSU D00513 TaxID=2812561 RepID=UPI001A969E08|nr:GlxA family transcriptional regulator [Azospirillum sp. SYSU D00513]
MASVTVSARSDGAPARAGLSVGFILTNNFTLTALSSFLDALRLAADDGDGSRPIRCRWTIMGTKPEPVMSSCGVPVARWTGFEDPKGFDYIVVVGGLLNRGPQLDAEAVAYLRRADEAGVTLVGVCTGSFVLSRVGLMKGRRCCVSWYHYRDFVEEFPDLTPVADQLYAVDRDRITCSGGSGVVDLAAYLIERHLGRAAAQKSMHIMQIERARPASEPQPQPAVAAVAGETGRGEITDERVRRAALLMEQHLNDPLAIEEIARRLNVSSRQFERLFHASTGMSPAAFYRALRLRYGLWMLKNSSRSVTAIALEAGFADCAHFSRQFRDFYGFSPSDARQPGGGGVETPPVEALWLARDVLPPDRRLFD